MTRASRLTAFPDSVLGAVARAASSPVVLVIRGWSSVVLVQRCTVTQVRRQNVVVHVQCTGDGHVHVEILVGAEPPAEKHLRRGGFIFGPGPVGSQDVAVGLGVDRVVRLVVMVGESGVL